MGGDALFKIVFTDAGNDKVVYGYVSFENDLIKVVTEDNHTLFINKDKITFMKEV